MDTWGELTGYTLNTLHDSVTTIMVVPGKNPVKNGREWIVFNKWHCNWWVAWLGWEDLRKDISRKIRDYLRLDVMIMAGKSITYLGTAFKPQSGELSLKLFGEHSLRDIFGEMWQKRGFYRQAIQNMNLFKRPQQRQKD